MDVILTDTFTKSLRKLISHQRWYWLAIDAIRYDIPRFCSNLWAFKKDLWYNYDFDSTGSMRMLRTSLERNANAIEHYGNEVAESRLKKIAKIRRAVEILNHHIEDDFMELAEIQLGKKSVSTWDIEELEDGKGGKLIPLETEEQEAINMEIFKLSRELENSTWKELFSILQGQDYLEYAKNRPADEKFTEDQWYMWFDGSGMKCWWD
jgi:hypothetical protein